MKENIRQESLPKHIAVIMDGNGRWAKKKVLPEYLGIKMPSKLFAMLQKDVPNWALST